MPTGSQGGLQTDLQAQHRAYSNRLLPEVPTFVEHLGRAGYHTYMAGKWHLGHVAESLPGARAVDFEAGMSAWDDLADDARAGALARMEAYAAMVDRLDENVGILVERLRARGELAHTVVVFISDNGAEAHDMESSVVHGDWVERNFDNSLANIGTASSYTALQEGWARATAAPFRASKSKVSEGGIRVPGFVALPGQAPAVDDSYMRVMDPGPTFLQIAQAHALPGVHGRSLLTRWQGGAPAYGVDDEIAFEVYGRRGVQRGPWKLLLQEAPYGTGEWQLYDLSTDLGEQRDVSAAHPEVRAALIAAWERYAEQVGVVLPEHPIRY